MSSLLWLLAACVALAGAQHQPALDENLIEGSGVEGSGDSVEGSGANADVCPPALDLLFVVDSSGSSRHTFSESMRWMLNLVDLLPLHRGEVHAGAVQYAGTAMPEFALDTYSTHRDVYEHLNGLVFRSGVTRTGAALLRAKIELFRDDRGGRPYANKVILLFSDGLSIDDPAPVADELRAAGVAIYAVALAHDAYAPALRRIVAGEGAPDALADGRIFKADQLEELKSTLLRDVELARRCGGPPAGGESPFDTGSLASNEVLSQYDDQGLEEIYNELEIDGVSALTTRRRTTTRRPATTRRTTRRRATTRRQQQRLAAGGSRATLAPLTPNIDSSCPVDLLIMLDSSGSVQHEYYVQKDFVAKILEGMSPMYNQRVAIMQFAGEGLQKTEFSFDDYKGYDDVKQAFSKVRHFTGTTHIGKALEHAMELLRHRRREALNYVLLVSDGYTQDDLLTPAERLRQSYPDVKIYAVGLADDNKREALQQVTGAEHNVFVGVGEADRFRREMFGELRGCRRR